MPARSRLAPLARSCGLRPPRSLASAARARPYWRDCAGSRQRWRRSRPVGLDHERRFRFFPDLSRSENTGTGEDGDFWDAPHSRAEHAASLRQRGPPTGFPPLTSRLAACFFADMRGVPARLPCRTAPRTPVPAIPPADGPLACQCRTSTPVPAIPLVPASPSTYRARRSAGACGGARTDTRTSPRHQSAQTRSNLDWKSRPKLACTDEKLFTLPVSNTFYTSERRKASGKQKTR